MIYIGIGFIISAVILWVNVLGLKDKAHIVVYIYSILFVVTTWGFWVVMFMVVSIIDFLITRWPMERVTTWWSDQFDEQYDR